MAHQGGPMVALIQPSPPPPPVWPEDEAARAVLASEEEDDEDEEGSHAPEGIDNASEDDEQRDPDEEHPEREEEDGPLMNNPLVVEHNDCDDCFHSRRFVYPQPRLKSSLLRSMRRSTGLHHWSPSSHHGGRRSTATPATSTAVVDILTLMIQWQMYHLSDQILSYLDAVSLRTCEEVCCLWRGYIRHQKTWRKVVVNTAKETPQLMELNGWNRLLSRLNSTRDMVDIDVFKNVSDRQASV